MTQAETKGSGKAVVRRFSEEIVNRGNFETLADLVAEDVEFDTTVADVARGRDGVRQIFSDLHRGFSNLACAVDALVEEGDVVAERFTFTGTHTGEFRGLPATNQRVEFNGMAFFRIANGKIVARWGVEDHLRMMQQLGYRPQAQ